MIYRFDDVCINSNMELHNQMTDWLFEKFPDCEVIWAVSPLVHSSEKETQRVFPKEWNALSDWTQHLELNDFGIPKLHPKVLVASHGLFHVDHRLLNKESQRISIKTSLALIGHHHRIFVPPFNKWNQDTESVCKEDFIELIKFESGWASMEYNKFTNAHEKWYLHAREWTFESFKNWFGCP